METFHPPFGVLERHDPTALDHTIRAYVHDDGDALSWENLSATATLVMTKDGTPIRSIITGRRHITTGSYASRKAGRALPYESMAERKFFMQSEVDPDVVDYRAQPFRFEFVIDGQKRTYIVDCVRLMADDTIEVVEVKHDARSLRDPDYVAKLQAVRMICERVGWRFRIVLQKALRTSRAFDDIVDIQSWRFSDFGQTDIFCVGTAIDQGITSLGDLAEALSCHVSPDDPQKVMAASIAKLKAMVVKRIIRFDLSHPLSLRTKVALVADLPEGIQ